MLMSCLSLVTEAASQTPTIFLFCTRIEKLRGELPISKCFYFFLSLPLFLKAGSYTVAQATLELCAIQADPKLMAVFLPVLASQSWNYRCEPPRLTLSGNSKVLSGTGVS